jgi:hypothetical protein
VPRGVRPPGDPRQIVRSPPARGDAPTGSAVATLRVSAFDEEAAVKLTLGHVAPGGSHQIAGVGESEGMGFSEHNASITRIASMGKAVCLAS